MKILSLGAGIQSSAMLLMALHGEFDWYPDHAIFCDTGAEPAHVYAQVDFLREQIGGRFPLHVVNAGSLETSLLDSLTTGGRTATPPFFVINRAGLPDTPPDTGGVLWRQCTKDYKLSPIRAKGRELWQESGKPHVSQYIGISLDEMERQKDSGVRYITNIYPLVDSNLTRHDCELWLKRHGYPIPGKSACHFCPYRSNRAWREMKRTDPATFARACDFDDKLRANGASLPGVTGEVFVHRSFMPLRMVDLDSAEDRGQQRLFPELIEECEGLCGV